MSRLGAGSARWVVRLVPAERRDWAEGLWAEADQVPPGLARATWLAGGVRLIAREARLVPRILRALVFAAAAAWIVRVAWPGPATNPATSVNRLNVVALLPVLAVLPLLARRLFGPAAPGRLAPVLRIGAYAAVLVLALAKASVEPMVDNPAANPYLNSDASTPVKDGMIFTWLTQSLFLLIVAMYVAVILTITARRTRVARQTLAAGTGTGLVLGAVLYAIFPIGFTKHATDPWLPGYAVGLLVALAWILLLGGPIVASAVAVRRYRGLARPGQDSPQKAKRAAMRQGAVAGFLATAVGALTVAALGTATVALMPRAGWLMHWLYPGQHLTAPAAYVRELTASARIGHYAIMLALFPFIGVCLSAFGEVTDASTPPGGGPPGPPGPPAPRPNPDPPVGVHLPACQVIGPATRCCGGQPARTSVIERAAIS